MHLGRLPLSAGLEPWAIRGPSVTYHNTIEERFRVGGRYADPTQASWVISAQVQQSLPEEASFLGPIHPDYHDAPSVEGELIWECNDSDRDAKRISDGYARAGMRAGDDPEAEIDVLHAISGDPLGTLHALAQWEGAQFDEPWLAWGQRPIVGSKIDASTISIAYYAICERFVSQGKVFWGFGVFQTFAPFGTAQYDDILDRIDKLRQVDEDVVVSVAGCYVRMRLLE